MRKLFLIATFSLAAATAAQAGQSRGLSLASAAPTQNVTESPVVQTASAPPAAQAPATAAAPAQPQQTQPPATATRTEPPARPKVRRVSTEARIIRELHRHGIYW